ncbi:MAG: SspB family protein [Alphaproteobacteria bacterium]
MSGDRIDYDALLRRSLLNLVREILIDTATHGLRGDHHYFVAFATNYPGVIVPNSLRERHPKDMTIVLQNQFWDLQVDEDRFSVKLNFNGKSEYLEVPFDALLGFLDPSVQFALPFKELADPVGQDAPVETAPESADDEPNTDNPDDNVVALDAFRKQQ